MFFKSIRNVATLIFFFLVECCGNSHVIRIYLFLFFVDWRNWILFVVFLKQIAKVGVCFCYITENLDNGV